MTLRRRIDALERRIERRTARQAAPRHVLAFARQACPHERPGGLYHDAAFERPVRPAERAEWERAGVVPVVVTLVGTCERAGCGAP